VCCAAATVTIAVAMRVSLLLSLLSLLALSAAVLVQGQSCLDENGSPVDWFMIVKMPKVKSAYTGVTAGTSYLYADARSYLTPSAFWKNSSHQVTDGASSVGRTLQQVYNAASDATQGYVFYSDQPPGTTNYSSFYGHSKGQLAWSSKTKSGFWLIHSVPRLAASPQNTQQYAYPSNAELYGQSMLCMSLTLPSIDQAFLQFQYSNPQVYGTQWVASLAAQMPNAVAFNGGQVVMNAASNVAKLTTVGGVTFTHYAKTNAWKQSIFGNLIGPAYGVDLVAETGQRPYEAPELPPATAVRVYSVRSIIAPSYANWDGVKYMESSDHAKVSLRGT